MKHMSRIEDVHLLVKWSFAAPLFRLTDQTNRKPSLVSPSVARYCESLLKASPRTPKVCSVRIDSGTSEGASFAVE